MSWCRWNDTSARANKARIGTNQIDGKDLTASLSSKNARRLAKQRASFVKPSHSRDEPKQMYCERLDTTTVCGGIYQ